MNADLYTPPAPGAQPAAVVNPGTITLYQNIKRLKLDVVQHVPIHGRLGSNDDFLKIVGKANYLRRIWTKHRLRFHQFGSASSG